MSKNGGAMEHQYNKVPIKENCNEKQEIPTHYGYGVRHQQLVIVLLCLTVSFLARGHLGVTVVAMTSHAKASNAIQNTSLAINITRRNETNTAKITTVHNDAEATEYFEGNSTNSNLKQNDTKPVETYDWSKSTQEMVLGSFFVGYCIMTFPIGIITQRWGGKLPMQIALFVNGIVSLVTPWLTFWGGWKAVCFCRIMQGLSQAGVYPSVQTLLANWVPTNERARLTSYVHSGMTVGTVIAFQLAGFLGASRLGWPSTFWAVGVMCLLAFTFLTIFGSASPTQHGSISQDEKNYILGRVDDKIRRKRPQTPWKAILKSRPMWATLATHVGSGVTFVFFFTQVPSYIHYILGIDVKSSGFLSSLPYVSSFFTSIMFGITSDYFTNRKRITLQNARKLSNSISQVGIAVSLMLVSFTTSTGIAVTLLVVAMSCHMGVHTGWMVNHIDLAPNFSGTLMAIGNFIMNIMNVLLPVMVSQVVTDVRDQMQWRIMLFSIAGLALTCNAIFVIFMSSDTQPWNDVGINDTSIEESKLDDLKEKKEKE